MEESKPSEVKKYKSYSPEHEEGDINSLIQEELGTTVSKLERIDAGSINAVYHAILENGEEVFVRVSPAERGHNNFNEEVWAYSLCREKGVPTPEVIAVDTSLSKFGEAYMITRKLPGVPGDTRSITREERESALREMGHYLSLIHSIKLPGFGSLVPYGKGFRGKYDSLLEAIAVDPNPDNDEEMAGMVEEIRANMEKHSNLLKLEQGALVHSDLAGNLDNALVENGHITGVLDMENVRITDPIYDFAYFTFHDSPDESMERLKLLCEGYDNKSLFDENFELKRTLLSLKLGVNLSNYYERRNNPKRVQRVRAKLRYLLDQLKSY